MNVSEKDLERQAPCDGGCGTVLTKVEAWAGAGAEAEADMDWASSEKHVSRPCPPQSVPEEDSTATAVTRARAVPVGECTEDDTTVTPDCQGEEPSVPTFEPPDGGLAAWSQVLAGHLINSVAWGYSTSWGVFQLYYTSHLRSSDGSPIPTAQVAWIGSAQVFLTFLICAPAGRLADAGYSRQLVFWGSVLAVGGTFLTSWCHTYWQVFLAQGVLTGFGLGWLFMPAVSVISAYFRRRRSLALAIAATGTGTGSLVFPATVQYLVPKVGFPWAVRCSGFVTLAFAVLFNVLLRPPLAPRKTGPLVEWSAFREPEYVLFVAGAFLFFWALLVGFYYINSYARNVLGFDATTSVTLLLVTNGAAMPVRPLVGFLADLRTGPINMFACTTFILGLVLYAWIGVGVNDSRVASYVFAAFFGAACGMAQGIFVGALASLTRDPRKMGTRFGMCCTIVAFAVLSGPPTAGAILDRLHGRYLGAQLWAGTVMVMSAATLGAARLWVTGWKLWVKV